MIEKYIFEKILVIAEQPNPEIIEKYAREEFGGVFEKLIESKALEYSRELSDILVSDGDNDFTVDVVRKDGKSVYRSPSGIWTEAETHEITIYRINFEWLIREILKALSIREDFTPKVLLEGNIWLLGQQWIDRAKKHSIILVRNINDQLTFERLASYLKEEHGRGDSVLILTWSTNIPLYLRLAGQHVLMRIEDAMVIESEHFEFNLRAISDKLGVRTPMDGFSSDFLRLRFEGEDYEFTTMQSRAIRYMARERKPLHKARILEEICPHSNSDLKDVFKAKGKPHKAWGKVICYNLKGMYWLDERIPLQDDM